jgi:hypothetical protein
MKSNFSRSSRLVVLAIVSVTWLWGNRGRADDSQPATASAAGGDAALLSDQLAARFNKAAEAALREMKQEAEKRKTSGAAVVALIPGSKTSAWSSRMQVVGSFVLNKYNVLGVAYSKAAEMADTLQNSGSGSRPPYKGELGYKGGVIEKQAFGYLLSAFSGGKTDDDLAVARIGLATLAKEMNDAPAGK